MFLVGLQQSRRGLLNRSGRLRGRPGLPARPTATLSRVCSSSAARRYSDCHIGAVQRSENGFGAFAGIHIVQQAVGCSEFQRLAFHGRRIAAGMEFGQQPIGRGGYRSGRQDGMQRPHACHALALAEQTIEVQGDHLRFAAKRRNEGGR